MAYKFEQLEVWQLALEYSDLIYDIAERLPRSEEYNLKSQMIRAATGISLNIAEGSTSQNDAEQARFLGLAVRSLIETVACQHHVNRRQYIENTEILRDAYRFSERLFAKLQAFRSSLNKS
jgi:four helix bundle protein